jgi:Sulfotransferase family
MQRATVAVDRGDNARPIFVVGPSRSGTSMLREILNRHSQVWVTRETHYFDDLRVGLGARAGYRLSERDAGRCEAYFLALGHRAYGLEGDPSRSAVAVDELRREAARLGGSGDAYFEAFCLLRARENDKIRWGEKTPRHVFRIPEMLALWPEAKVICLVRDPRGVAASYRDWKRGGRTVDPENVVETDRRRAGGSYNVVINSLLWKSAMQAAGEALRRYGPERIQLQAYEELVSTPELALRDLVSWLGLEYEGEMLDVPIVQSSYPNAASTSGISRAPVDRWRERLSPTEIHVIQSVCGSVMEDLGYRREPARPSRLGVAWTWAAVPVAFVRAWFLNRRRLGRAPAYIRRRLGLALMRGNTS